MSGKLPPVDWTQAHDANASANDWTQRGISFLNENTPDKLAAALDCFDRAIELRRSLPLQVDPWWRFGLVAGWLNRADALTRLGRPADLEAALDAQTQALAQLEALPNREDPAFERRRAVAWASRGVTLQKRDAPGDRDAAIEAFQRATGGLQNGVWGVAGRESFLAGVQINLARAFLAATPTEYSLALAAAQRARGFIAPREADDLEAAELGLTAHFLLCQCVGGLLASPAISSQRDDWIAQATDAVEHGLQLARQWDGKSNSVCRRLADDLFLFGARLYQTFQPQFLGEYLLEHLHPTSEPASLACRCAVAREALWRAFHPILHLAFASVHRPGFVRALDQLGELSAVEAQLDRWVARRLDATG